jgi:hypothetical protein
MADSQSAFGQSRRIVTLATPAECPLKASSMCFASKELGVAAGNKARWLPPMSAARNGVFSVISRANLRDQPPTRESSMRPSSRRHVLGVAASLVIAALSPAIAQEQSHTAKGPETSLISRVLTGKERLGRKWMDEQRMDNCKVPIDKRGTKPRLDTC